MRRSFLVRAATLRSTAQSWTQLPPQLWPAHVVRILPRLLAGHGLEASVVQDHLCSEVGHSSFFLGLAEYIGPLIAASGAVSAGVVDSWLGELRQANDNGVYFGFCNYYTYIATKRVT
jgi:hypothetical protein